MGFIGMQQDLKCVDNALRLYESSLITDEVGFKQVDVNKCIGSENYG